MIPKLRIFSNTLKCKNCIPEPEPDDLHDADGNFDRCIQAYRFRRCETRAYDSINIIPNTVVVRDSISAREHKSQTADAHLTPSRRR